MMLALSGCGDSGIDGATQASAGPSAGFALNDEDVALLKTADGKPAAELLTRLGELLVSKRARPTSEELAVAIEARVAISCAAECSVR
ncbi:MAG TPA: hypothetical protein VM598_06795 [Bdellovibrionota bacterium]|nr:hypothetical protein [Bdellovibrionota bacterium]